MGDTAAAGSMAPGLDTWRLAATTKPHGRFGSTCHSWQGLAGPVRERETHEREDARFIDWILLARGHMDQVSVRVAAVATEAAYRECIPMSVAPKLLHPSDHFPVLVDIEVSDLGAPFSTQSGTSFVTG